MLTLTQRTGYQTIERTATGQYPGALGVIIIVQSSTKTSHVSNCWKNKSHAFISEYMCTIHEANRHKHRLITIPLSFQGAHMQG